MIEAELQVVEHGLLIARAEAGEDFLTNVGLPVAIGVLEIPDVGRRGDEHTTFPRYDAADP